MGSDDGLQGCKRRWLKGWVEKVGEESESIEKVSQIREQVFMCTEGVCCEEEDISWFFTYGRQGRERQCSERSEVRGPWIISKISLSCASSGCGREGILIHIAAAVAVVGGGACGNMLVVLYCIALCVVTPVIIIYPIITYPTIIFPVG